MNSTSEPERDQTSVTPDQEPAVEAASPSQPAEKKTPMYVIIVGIILTLLVIMCLQVDDWSRDLTTNFAQTQQDASDINLRPIDSELPPNELADLVTKRMRDAARWDVQETKTEPDGSIIIPLIHRTLIIGFKDDVIVTIRPSQSGSQLTATSQSRVGKGDLGQNPRNLKELIGLIRGGLSDE